MCINKDGHIIIDETLKAGGRGAYICKDEKCLQKAVKRKALEHNFKIRISKEEYSRIGINGENDR